MKNRRHDLDAVLAELAEQDALLHGATARFDPDPDAGDDADVLDRVFELRFGATHRTARLTRPAHGFLLRA